MVYSVPYVRCLTYKNDHFLQFSSFHSPSSTLEAERGWLLRTEMNRGLVVSTETIACLTYFALC